MPPVTLKDDCYLKRLEEPYIYDAAADELYSLDEEAFLRIRALADGAAEDGEAADLLNDAGLAQKCLRKDPAAVPGSAADPSLRYLEVQITARCDKACLHCYLGSPAPVDMNPEAFTSLLGQFVLMQGLKVMVSGGEPRCHPDFATLCSSLSGYPFRRVLITHGEKVTETEARQLAGWFHQIQISLDGMESGHDALRGAGSFQRVLRGMSTLREAGAALAVGTMVHEGNLEDFDRMSILMEQYGVEEWAVDVPCPAGRWDLSRLADTALLREMSTRLRYAYGGGYHGGSAGLACGSHLMTVFPDGAAAKCGFYPPAEGPDAIRDLPGAWSRIRHVPQSLLACDCDELEFCAGGCRFRAEVLEGDPLAIDRVQCYARGVK